MENVHFYFPLLDHFYIDIYKYHTFLHHSQTLEAANETYKSLNTIHFYIILKLYAGIQVGDVSLNTIHFYIILKPLKSISLLIFRLNTIHFYIILKLSFMSQDCSSV